MQRTASCRGLQWFKYSSVRTVYKNSSPLHTSFLSIDEAQLQPSSNNPSGAQELSDGSGEGNYQHIKQLRQINCWKLWQLRGLSVEEISCILHMRQDTIIKVILSIEINREGVNWLRLCKLVSLTTLAAQTVLVAMLEAKRESLSLYGATLFSVSDNKKFYPKNVKSSHVFLVHAMLERQLTSSEIIELASSTNLDHKGTCEMEVTDSSLEVVNTTNAIISSAKTARNIAFPQHDRKLENAGGEESVENVMPTSNAGSDKSIKFKMQEKYADSFLSSSNVMPTSNAGSDKSLRFKMQEKYAVEVLTDSSGSVTSVSGEHSLTEFDILRWLRKNDMATISSVINEFRNSEAKHLLFLLLKMLESSTIVEQQGMLRIASEQSACRLEKPARSPLKLSASPIHRRMHRALCMKAIVLNVVIHEPRSDVEFTIRHIKADNVSTVYRVQICKHPSCTCPDFGMRSQEGLDYMPCKHLIYVYLVQLHLEKNFEHLMLQKSLKAEDLERILEGHH